MKYILAMLVVVLTVSTANCESAPAGVPEATAFQEKIFTISGGVGIMGGETAYQIGGRNVTTQGVYNFRFPLSELVFPLELFYGRIGGELHLFDRLTLKGHIKKNITGGTGKMEDSDWGQNYHTVDGWDDPNSLDIYSESKVAADAIVANAAIRYRLFEMTFGKSAVAFFAGGAFVYQEFDFTTSNLDQWYPSLDDYYGYDAGHIYIRETGLIYEVIQKMPVFTGGVTVAGSPGFTLDMELGYSPKATVEDYDNHLLRDKIAYGDCDGTAWLFSATGNIRFHDRWALDLRYDYIWVDTTGKQTQYIGGEYYSTIEQKIFSETHTFELALNFLF